MERPSTWRAWSRQRRVVFLRLEEHISEIFLGHSPSRAVLVGARRSRSWVVPAGSLENQWQSLDVGRSRSRPWPRGLDRRQQRAKLGGVGNDANTLALQRRRARSASSVCAADGDGSRLFDSRRTGRSPPRPQSDLELGRAPRDAGSDIGNTHDVVGQTSSADSHLKVYGSITVSLWRPYIPSQAATLLKSWIKTIFVYLALTLLPMVDSSQLHSNSNSPVNIGSTTAIGYVRERIGRVYLAREFKHPKNRSNAL